MKKIKFTGEGSKYFGIWAVNTLLIILTLGLYYPWAKEKMRKYLWNETSLEGSKFMFHGTGKEMFKGFIKAYGFILVLYFIFFVSQITKEPVIAIVGLLVFYLAILIIIPLAIYGAWRYRTSRTSWRGIHFSFTGKLKPFLKQYFIDLLLTILTFGIYGTWLQNNVRSYLLNHTKLGNYKFSYHGKSSELFGITFLGMFLTMITLYIYLPFFMKNVYEFQINNTSIDGKALNCNLKGSAVFGIMFTNLLLLIFTLGLAFPWVIIRTQKMILESIQLPEDLDLNNIQQSLDNYKDATGDDMADVLDLGLDF